MVIDFTYKQTIQPFCSRTILHNIQSWKWRFIFAYLELAAHLPSAKLKRIAYRHTLLVKRVGERIPAVNYDFECESNHIFFGFLKEVLPPFRLSSVRSGPGSMDFQKLLGFSTAQAFHLKYLEEILKFTN